MNRAEQMLLGKWISAPDDQSSEESTLEFKAGGQLDYTIRGADKDQKIFLTYRVEGDVLVTDQPSHPREERTSFVLTDEGKLVLMYGDQRSSYVRADASCS
jgi:hypothetical protein